MRCVIPYAMPLSSHNITHFKYSSQGHTSPSRHYYYYKRHSLSKHWPRALENRTRKRIHTSTGTDYILVPFLHCLIKVSGRPAVFAYRKRPRSRKMFRVPHDLCANECWWRGDTNGTYFPSFFFATSSWSQVEITIRTISLCKVKGDNDEWEENRRVKHINEINLFVAWWEGL